MSDRQYTTKIEYPAIFWADHSPKNASFQAALRGVMPIDVSEPFTYCDLACGPGETLALYAKCYPHAHFFGVDINEAHVKRAQERVDELGLDNVTVLKGDLRDLSNLDLPQFDFIALAGVISWLPLKLQREALKSACSLLSPNGLLIVHYMVAPIAGLLRCVPALLSALSPKGRELTIEDVKGSFEKFKQLADVRFGVFYEQRNSFERQYQKFTRHPDYTAHDYLEASGTLLSFEDFADMVEENGAEFVTSAARQISLPDAYVSPTFQHLFDVDGDWRSQQTLLHILAKSGGRVDIFSKPRERVSLDEILDSDFFKTLWIDVWHRDWRGVLARANKAAQINLEATPYLQIMERAASRACTIGEIVAEVADQTQDTAATLRRIAHLVAWKMLFTTFAPVDVAAADVPEVRLTLEDFEFADDLWRYLAQDRPMPLPSQTLGECLQLALHDKMNCYLACGGDPDILFNRVKNLPQFAQLKGPNGAIGSGAELAAVLTPTLPVFHEAVVRNLKRYRII